MTFGTEGIDENVPSSLEQSVLQADISPSASNCNCSTGAKKHPPLQRNSRQQNVLRNNGRKTPSGQNAWLESKLSSSQPEGLCDKKWLQSLIEEFVRVFARGFASGAGLYAGVRIFTALLRNPFRKSVPLIWHSIWSRDSLAVASFLGLCPSVYHLLVRLLTRLRQRQDGWTYGVAGGLSGLTVALLDNSRQRTLAFFTFSRALGAAVSTMVTRGHLTGVPYFEVYTFCACVSLIVYCVAMSPHYLSQGYYRSVVKWSRDYTDSNMERVFRTPGTRFVTCSEAGFHEGSCTAHRLRDLFNSLPGFAKLYLPIHLTPVLVFKRKLLMERPRFVLESLVKNLAISTSFLGLMVFLAKVTICLLRNAVRRPPPLPGFIPAVAGAVCGLALLLERSSRRKELTMFVIPHVLNILRVAAQKSDVLRPLLRVPFGVTAMFALSMSSVMHAYEREPHSLSLLISGILRFFFGSRRCDGKAIVTNISKNGDGDEKRNIFCINTVKVND